MTDESGVRFGIATGIVVVTVLIATLAGIGEIDSAILVLAVGGVVAVSLRPWLAPLVGLVAWAFWTGFVENAFGQLTLAGPDLARLAGFAAVVPVLAYGVRNVIDPAGRLHG